MGKDGHNSKDFKKSKKPGKNTGTEKSNAQNKLKFQKHKAKGMGNKSSSCKFS